MTDALTGGCHCGRHRYEITKPVTATHCLCESCRRSSGGTLVTWVTVPKGGFRWTTEPPAFFASAPKVARGFCATCGTSLSYQHADEDVEIDVTAATLDDPGLVAPYDHIWGDYRLPWSPLDPNLPVLGGSHRHASDRAKD